MSVVLTRPCSVDGCDEPITLTMLDTFAPGDPLHRWEVRHGTAGEAAIEMDGSVLFVWSGYRPWVREIHRYEAMRGEQFYATEW